MLAAAAVGVYGKLPMYGDFVQRNLPANFVAGWDEWTQHFIAGSKEQLGEAWLDIYLTSPIWRFVISAGIIDKHAWAGILMPSVDSVGRYYPFAVVVKLPEYVALLDFLATQTAWFDSVEELALQALDEQMQLDELVEQIATVELNFNTGYARSGGMPESNAFHIEMEFEEQSPGSVYGYLLDGLLAKTYLSYSVWSTRGSERIAPCLFSVQGLPPVSKLPAMLDGQWQHWGWPQPFGLGQ